ncbi:MAG TPA: phosphate signaling complex protein PhoU [Blastocatellia bacterium]
MHNRLIEGDLNRLRDKLLVMGGAAEHAIAFSIQALIERDSETAERVIREDDLIDQMELEIDQMCVDILALKQPAASDLRFVISTARVAPTVERIADHAVNIAKHALSLNDKPQLDIEMDVAKMAGIVQEMLVEGLDAFTSGDPSKAESTISEDDDVDALYASLYAQLIKVMTADSTTVERGVEWTFVIKHLERMADYVTNICEQIVYMARGQVIKHTVW